MSTEPLLPDAGTPVDVPIDLSPDGPISTLMPMPLDLPAPPRFRQLGLIGCGLIGGSFAMAMRRAGLVQRVVGYSKSPTTTERARRLGVIDDAAESALVAVSGADIVLVAVPVGATEATLRAIRPLVEPTMLVMDVGSTKRDVVDAARRSLRDRIGAFVPAHPIAGKERAGVDHADAALFEGHQVILTPISQTLPAAVELAAATWAALGARVSRMSAEEHDASFAAVSHLPHLLAFAYFTAIARHPQGEQALSLAGPGFRDFTRIAASDPTVWRDVLIANREEVLQMSATFRATLAQFEGFLQTGDSAALEAAIDAAARGRGSWQHEGRRGRGGPKAP